MGSAEQKLPNVDLRAPTPEAAAYREKIAKHIDELAALVRNSQVRAISIDWRNAPIEGMPDGQFKTWLANPFSTIDISAEFEGDIR